MSESQLEFLHFVRQYNFLKTETACKIQILSLLIIYQQFCFNHNKT